MMFVMETFKLIKGVQHNFLNMPENISLKSNSYTDHCGTTAF